jgi:hypothetical protein
MLQEKVMKNYVYIYHSTQTTPPTAEALGAWGEWFETLQDNLVDSGNPITQAKAVLKNGAVEKKGDTVVGYSVIKANSLDEAIELAKNSPLAGAPGGEIRVYETGQM